MGKVSGPIVVKLGGSVITDKRKPLSANIRNLRLIAGQISRALRDDPSLKLFLIHGGGSFGHYYAKKFGLGTKLTRSASPEGLARTAAAMIDLHSIVLNELCRAGLYCGTVLPIELFSGGSGKAKISSSGKARMNSIYQNGLTPISFGNVNFLDDNSLIVSGDKIALAIASSFDIPRAIFVTDVDGVYQSSDLKGSIIEELKPSQFSIESSLRGYDVTGGIRAKVSTAFDLSRRGADVYFVNGTKSNRLLGLIRGSKDVLATRIYSEKKSPSQSSRVQRTLSK